MELISIIIKYALASVMHTAYCRNLHHSGWEAATATVFFVPNTVVIIVIVVTVVFISHKARVFNITKCCMYVCVCMFVCVCLFVYLFAFD